MNESIKYVISEEIKSAIRPYAGLLNTTENQESVLRNSIKQYLNDQDVDLRYEVETRAREDGIVDVEVKGYQDRITLNFELN